MFSWKTLQFNNVQRVTSAHQPVYHETVKYVKNNPKQVAMSNENAHLPGTCWYPGLMVRHPWYNISKSLTQSKFNV